MSSPIPNAANVITPTNYLAIATDYADIVSNISVVSAYLYDAVYTIVSQGTYDPTIDLLDPFNNVYTANTNVYSSLIPFFPAVKALNNHVLNRAGLTGQPGSDINTYLSDAQIQVPYSWQVLCAAAGITIQDDYVVGGL